MSQIETVMRTSPVIPVLVIHDAAQARPLAEALVAGGLKVLEVTLRTPAARAPSSTPSRSSSVSIAYSVRPVSACQ